MKGGAQVAAKGAGLSIRWRWQRIVVGALVGAVAAAAPHVILYLGYQDQGQQIYDGLLPMFTLTASALLAALVITLLVRARPDWTYGVGGAAVVAILSATAWGFVRPDFGTSFSPSSAGFVFMYTFLVGMAGASIASLTSRSLMRDRFDGKPKRIKPWHTGVTVLVLELVLVGAVAAVWA